MRLVAPDRLAAARIADAGQKPLHEPGGDPRNPEHHHHRRGVVLAIARPGVDEAVHQATPAAVDVRDVRAVGEMGAVAQVRLDRARGVIRVGRLGGGQDLRKQRARLGPDRARLDRGVGRQQAGRVVGPGRPEAVRGQRGWVGRVGEVRQAGLQRVARSAGRQDSAERRFRPALHQGDVRRAVEKGRNPGRDHDAARREAADLVVVRHVADGVEGRVERPRQEAHRRPDVQVGRLAPAPGVPDELVVGDRAPLDERAAGRRLDREDRRGIGHPEARDGGRRPELGAGDAGPRSARREVADPLLGNLGELLVQARPCIGERRR